MASRLFARSALRRPLLGAALTASVFAGSRLHADAQPVSPSEPLSSLVRAYVVYTLCSFPVIVDSSPKILSYLTSVPGLRTLTEGIVRVTFFDQFVGGDTAEGCIPLLRNLRARNTGALFAYSVEVDENAAMGADGAADLSGPSPHAQIVNEMVHSIDVAADFEDALPSDAFVQGSKPAPTSRKTWVAVKLTALLPDAHALHRLSSHILAARKTYRDSVKPKLAEVEFPGAPHDNDLDAVLGKDAVIKGKEGAIPAKLPAPLTQADALALAQLYSDLCRICARAQERGVRIIIDAEYSWYEPAIDAFTHALMRRVSLRPSDSCPFSDATKVQPLIYGTYQAYLRRTPAHLARAAADAAAGGYSLGVKLVRGAYHPFETGAWQAARTALADIKDPELAKLARISLVPGAPHPPVWTEKPETDASYDRCAETLVGWIAQDVKNAQGKSAKGKPVQPRIGVLFGTHNWASCAGILGSVEKAGLGKRESPDGPLVIPPEVTRRLTIGQLYGMSDDLTASVVGRVKSAEPFVIKYVPYGALKEVLPYLGRRAIENKSMLFGQGGAAHERQRAWSEFWARVW
ncbi:FAD-linked oxidoreductase-like protein [Schizophyllum amplum]|uniref:Proline dehydrogenase n=1 Tax=Schizophyllum amplum TaxID=97359 RepID=A0A550C347_9AGAR|nr:FAD-linked oxidoreductase-like protein [Auriculariopsis ampla]